MKIDENIWKVFKEAIDITNTDYDIKWYDAENFEGYIEENSILSLIEDLVGEVEHLKDENKDLENKLYGEDLSDIDRAYENWKDSQL